MSSSQTVDGHDLVQWALWLPDGEAIVDGDDRLPSEAELREMASHLLADEGEQLHEWTPQDLLRAVAGFARLAATAQELMAETVAALARHPQVRRGRTREDSDEWIADELSMALGVSGRQARELLARGRATSSWLHEVGEQARTGLLDVARVRVFVEELDLVPPETVCAVLDQALPKARHLTACALRRLVRRIVAQVDPEGQADRAESWLERRNVQPVRPDGPGMGLFSALLPAGGAVALETACEAAAKAARAAGDARTLDQLHADVLMVMGQQALVTGTVGVEGLTDEVFRFDPINARVRLIATPEAQEGRPTVDPERGITGIEPYARDLYGASDGEVGDGDVGDDESGGGRSGGERCGELGRGDGDDGADGRVDDVATPERNEADDDGDCDGANDGDAANNNDNNNDDDDAEPLPVRPAPQPGVEVPELLGFGPVTPREAAALVSRRWVSVRQPVVLADHPPPDSSGYRPRQGAARVRADEGSRVSGARVPGVRAMVRCPSCDPVAGRPDEC